MASMVSQVHVAVEYSLPLTACCPPPPHHLEESGGPSSRASSLSTSENVTDWPWGPEDRF
jgi:hypothetical protein